MFDRQIFEKILYSRMVQFSVKYLLFASEKMGLREKSYCFHAISTVTDYIWKKNDKRTVGQACFSDLLKALNTLDPLILLKGLNAFGFRGLIFEVSSDYFGKSFHYLETDNNKTVKLRINTGVPQESILCRFLFLAYINDFAINIGNLTKIAIFADDTSIVKASPRNQCNLPRTWID